MSCLVVILRYLSIFFPTKLGIELKSVSKASAVQLDQIVFNRDCVLVYC